MGAAPRVGVTAVVLAVLLAPVPAAPSMLAAQRSIDIEDFHSEIEVRADASILVTETIRPRFTGRWNGFVRVLELHPPDNYGARYLLDIDQVAVTDDAGTALRHEVSQPRRATTEVRIWVPDAADRTATVHLSYRVRRALGFFEADPDGEWDAMDELYWQVTGTDWEMTIGRASARITLPPGATVRQAEAYVGARRSTTRATVTTTGRVVDIPAAGPLAPGHGLTVGVGWPAGLVDRPATAAAARGTPGAATGTGPPTPGPLAYWPLLIPFAVFWAAYRAWDRKGRDPVERSITVQWEPPAALSAVEAGTLVDHRAEMHDILSILVDLAVRGYLVIEERERTGFLRSGKDYRFHLMKPRDEWTDLAPFERRFLVGLFSAVSRPDPVAALGGRSRILRTLIGAMGSEPSAPAPPEGAIDTVRLTDLRNRFYEEITPIRDAVYEALIRKGHYAKRPDKAALPWVGLAAVAFAAGIFWFIAVIATERGALAAPAAVIIAAAASVITLGIFAAIMPARTEVGARTREAALGFKRFLERVETPRYKRMITSPDQFERFLPYAMAFKCEETWARAFDGLLSQPPDWYRGVHGAVMFRPSAFARDLGAMSTAAVSTLSSSPSSSGSGGGGSVGGGGGGGGGRGF